LATGCDEPARDPQAPAAAAPQSKPAVGREAYVTKLTEGLAARPVAPRYFAARSFGFTRDRSFCPLLIEVYDREEDQGVHQQIIAALGQLGGPEALAFLKKLAKNPQGYVRGAAFKAIGQLRDPSIKEFAEAALKHPNIQIRNDAVDGLGSWGSPEAVPIFRLAFQDALPKARIKVLESIGAMPEEAQVELFVAGLKDESPLVRARAAELYSQKPGRDPKPLHAVVSDASDKAGVAALEALGRLKDPTGAAPIVAHYPKATQSWRETAATVLGQLGNPDAVPILRDAAKEQPFALRGNAYLALARLKDTASMELLRNAVQNKEEEPYARHKAAVGLFLMGETTVLSSLGESIKNKDLLVRANAVYTMGDLQDPALLPLYSTALEDVEARVREEATKAIARYPAEQAIPLLDKATKDVTREVRCVALDGLAAFAGDATTAIIHRVCTKDSESEVRRYALGKLIERPGPQLIDALTVNAAEPETRLKFEAIGHWIRVQGQAPAPTR
jgi:HEAT repeat protein